MVGGFGRMGARFGGMGAGGGSAVDITAPTLSSPTDVAASDTTASLGVTTNEANGTLYYVVTTSATPPSAAQVKAGQNNAGTAAVYAGSQAITSTGVKTATATGLTAVTAYYTYFMHEDAAANQSSVSAANGFTTEATFDAADPFAKYTQSGIWIKDFDYSRAAASGLSRMYTTSDNQTLVTADTDPIGFVLDDSQGAAVGAAVLSDDFSYADVPTMVAAGWQGWVVAPGFIRDDGMMTLNAGRLRTSNQAGQDYSTAARGFSATVGAWYRVTVTNTQVTAAQRKAYISTGVTGGTIVTITINAAGTYSSIFRATATTMYARLGIDTATDGNSTEWDTLLVEPIAGNHLLQATAGQRGTAQDVGGVKVWRDDAVDDNLLANLSPAAGTTMFVRTKVTLGGVYIAGTQASASTRFLLTCNAGTGQLGAGVGSDGNTTITGGGDIQNVEGVAVLRADGTTVALWWFPVGGALSQLYTGAQNGTPTTTVPLRFGAINNNGSVGTTPLSGDLYKIFVVQAAMSDADVATMAAALAA